METGGGYLSENQSAERPGFFRDGGELPSLVRRLAPQSVYLVHRDADARPTLASAVDVFLISWNGTIPPHGWTWFGAIWNIMTGLGSRDRR